VCSWTLACPEVRRELGAAGVTVDAAAPGVSGAARHWAWFADDLVGLVPARTSRRTPRRGSVMETALPIADRPVYVPHP